MFTNKRHKQIKKEMKYECIAYLWSTHHVPGAIPGLGIQQQTTLIKVPAFMELIW